MPSQPAGPVGPVIVDERVQRSRQSPVAIFFVSFIAVAAVLGLIFFAIEQGGDASTSTTSTPSGDTGDTSDAEQPDDASSSTVAETFETSCAAGQLPDPNVRYRVTLIPDTFDEPTLNGRNVPSTSAVDGVTSVPITAFPELSELDLTYTSCEVAENGRIWWGVNYEGPDNSGADFSGIVWASTRFIEPVPDQ